VNVNTFGKLFSRTVDGQVYAQPLYVPNLSLGGGATRNVVYVATQNDTVYAFDADDPAASSPLWQVNLGTPVPNTDVSLTCADIAAFLLPGWNTRHSGGPSDWHVGAISSIYRMA
jgi:hypothetical protein